MQIAGAALCVMIAVCLLCSSQCLAPASLQPATWRHAAGQASLLAGCCGFLISQRQLLSFNGARYALILTPQAYPELPSTARVLPRRWLAENLQHSQLYFLFVSDATRVQGLDTASNSISFGLCVTMREAHTAEL